MEKISISTVKLLLQQQRDDFNDIVATLMKSFNDRYDQLRNEVVEIKQSLQFSQKDIDILLSSKSTQEDLVHSLKDGLGTLEVGLENLTSKVDYLENQSRRNNLRFDGVPETPKETWDESEEKIQDILKTKFGFSSQPLIERAHRVGPVKPQTIRPIVVKFNQFKVRDQVLHNGNKLKGSKIFVNEDLSERVMERRREQLQLLKDARSQGKLAYFSLDKLIIKERAQQVNTSTNKTSPGRPITRSFSGVSQDLS